jgi:hypothetical protein
MREGNEGSGIAVSRNPEPFPPSRSRQPFESSCYKMRPTTSTTEQGNNSPVVMFRSGDGHGTLCMWLIQLLHPGVEAESSATYITPAISCLGHTRTRALANTSASVTVSCLKTG